MACRPGELALESELLLIFSKYPLDHIQSLQFKPTCGTIKTEQHKEVNLQRLILVFKPCIFLVLLLCGGESDIHFLLQLKSRVSFHEHLLPVCLPPPNYELAPGTYCTVIGWGKKEDREGEYWWYRICCIVFAV